MTRRSQGRSRQSNGIARFLSEPDPKFSAEHPLNQSNLTGSARALPPRTSDRRGRRHSADTLQLKPDIPNWSSVVKRLSVEVARRDVAPRPLSRSRGTWS